MNNFEYFFYNNQDLACIANVEGYFEIINPNFEKILGYSEKELLEKKFLDFIHPDDIDSTLKEVEKLKSGAITINFVNRYRRKDGNYLWFEWCTTPDTSTGKLYAIARDITERRKAEENLQKSFKEVSDYKYALDESSIVAITDQHGIIRFANDNFCKISKYRREELIGQDHRIINSGYHPKEFIKDLWVTIANGKIWRGDLRNKAKDGTFYWVDTTIVPFLNKEGNPHQYIAIRADITEHKKAEEQLQSVNKELEAFTYSVSHDLRAPLRAVDGFANIIHEEYTHLLDEEGRRLLEVIQHNAKKMGGLIDDLLAFSRLGKKEVQKTNLDMKELAEAALFELNKSVQHKAEIKIGKLHSAKGDYGLINQVLLNLFSNAVKYSSKETKPMVEIKSEQQDGSIIYSIKDNGVGFDMQYAHKLFGVFQRLHKIEDFEGTGVGLAIVQRIVNKHGGKVWAEAELGKGATFKFSLPLN